MNEKTTADTIVQFEVWYIPEGSIVDSDEVEDFHFRDGHEGFVDRAVDDDLVGTEYEIIDGRFSTAVGGRLLKTLKPMIGFRPMCVIKARSGKSPRTNFTQLLENEGWADILFNWFNTLERLAEKVKADPEVQKQTADYGGEDRISITTLWHARFWQSPDGEYDDDWEIDGLLGDITVNKLNADTS